MVKRRSEPEELPPAAPPASTGPDPNDLLTTRELMEYLQISRTKVWELVRDEKNPLPAFKLGGDYRYRRAEVDAWMESLRVRPDDSPKNDE